MNPSTYKTKRLIIRPFGIRDYKAWYFANVEILSSGTKFDRKNLKPKMASKELFKKRVQKQRLMAKRDETYIWGLFDKSAGLLVGGLDVHIIKRDNYQMANLGYFIFNSYWRMGYAEEALRKSLKPIFKELKLQRLEAAIEPDNLPSINLVKKLGFLDEGLRKQYLYENGQWDDHCVFSIRATDFGGRGPCL